MKLKLLLFSLFMACGLLSAQEAYRQLIITEARMNAQPMSIIEITNVGDQTVNLADFELGKVTPWTGRVGYESGEPLPPIEDWFNVPENERMMLPDTELAPGESWVIASVSSWRLGMEKIDPFEYRWRATRIDYYDISDYQMHYPEPPSTPPVKDSVDPKYRVLEVWNGRDCWYLRHHFINGDGEKDSVVIDQVGGVFDQENGTNFDRSYSVAGIAGATNSHKLIRKATVTTGNLNFNIGRGVDLEDSEWMPIPNKGSRHHSMWHIGNHGSFVFDEDAFVSETADMDFDNGVITVDWGVQRDDSLVFQFEKVPGLAWYYRYVPNHADSAYLSARTGDTLRLIMLGDEMQIKEFHIEVREPGEDANIVIPKKSPNFATGWFGSGSAYIDNARFRATHGHEMDTIKHQYNIPGIAFATRVDTLFTYLEKAPAAEWEIVWVDDTERVDLKHGDILRVTAENGDVKDYFIKMEDYRPSDNAFLGSITWPDIPEEDRGMFGWVGDTIPGFSPTVYSYNLLVPGYVDGFPALVAKPQNSNARVEVTRAVSYAGPRENRTVTFKVTAESDTTVRTYRVLLEKEPLPEHVQPYEAEPIISEFIFWEAWTNGYVEIANVGNQPLDLSDYMLVNRYSEGPATAIEWELPFHNRYQKYIPGYKWTAEVADWEVVPLLAEPDPNINPIVLPGDVFTIGETHAWWHANDALAWHGVEWWVPKVLNIDFGFKEIGGERVPENPWGEKPINPETNAWGESAARQWMGADFYLFKILNDSVKLGTKPATDPADFEVIDMFGTGDATDYAPIGVTADMINSFVRKPEIEFGQPLPGGSFGDTPEESEWLMYDRAYWIRENAPWPLDIMNIALDFGQHSFIPATFYKSTVTSISYVVSPGFQDDEWIRGITTGTTVSEFLDRLTKADPDQTLSVVAGGDTLASDDVFADGDALHVMSADSTNITIYNLIVTADGLRSDAELTSEVYDIEIDGATAIISGFEMGTLLKTVREGVVVPDGATLTIVDENDAYVPFKRLNFDSVYVDVKVTDRIFFDVVAEDGETKILYQLMPDSDPSDAFVYSEVYDVDQVIFTIDLVPTNTAVPALLNNLTPSIGATMQVVDKMGHERNIGTIYRDDRVFVTSQNEEVTNMYFLTLLGLSDDYLAYIVSDIYIVDQLNRTIYMEVDERPTVAEVLALIEIAPGSTIEVMDSERVEKTESELVYNEDVFRVTAANGLNVTEYTLSIVVLSVDDMLTEAVTLYPNPSTGIVYMDGIEPGSRIQVYNIVGVPVLNVVARNSTEVLSLENQPGGIYFVVVSNNNEITGRHKLILR
ncbi:MAG: T9SS C-terminal target domain-containing protein [Marinilabiliales bacterium]|nr:MAG: T9SS C-terminal target domain-containing protein [Marinilabiliales bacterium]